MRKSKWFGTLLSCPYCIGHWLALVATGLYRPYVTDLNPVLDFGVGHEIGGSGSSGIETAAALSQQYAAYVSERVLVANP